MDVFLLIMGRRSGGGAEMRNDDSVGESINHGGPFLYFVVVVVVFLLLPHAAARAPGNCRKNAGTLSKDDFSLFAKRFHFVLLRRNRQSDTTFRNNVAKPANQVVAIS